MKASTAKFLIGFGYVALLAWIVPALTYSVCEVVEQHEIFSLLRTIRYEKDSAIRDKAVERLGEFGLEGLIYIIQELKQDEGRDSRIKVANVLERFLTGDSDRTRWGWGERGALYGLLETWPETPGSKMGEFDDDNIKRLLMKNRAEISPKERQQILNFAMEYALIVMDWKVEDSLEIFTNRARRLQFKAFLDLVRAEQLKIRLTDSKPEVELSGDQMKRAEDFRKDWLDKEEAKREKLVCSEDVALAEKLQAFLAGDPVKLESEDCDKMIKLVNDWKAEEEKLSPKLKPGVYSRLKEKLRRFADGAPVNFTTEDSKALCSKLAAFKDDYISYAVEVKFRRATESYFREFIDKGLEPIDITADEIPVVLMIVRQCRREYAFARVQMARTARRIVRDLVHKKARFQILVRDVDKDQGVFAQLSQSWKAKNDEIVMLDLLHFAQDDDFGVRANVSDALVAIGEPAIYYLVEQLKKERVSSTAVVPTRDKGREEREKELNAENTRARREVAMMLGRIGSEEAEKELERMTKDPVIGNTVHQALDRLRAQRKRR